MDRYCPIASLTDQVGERACVVGMIIEERSHRQSDGRLMKFISLCDYSGSVEVEIFADAYKRYGIATVRFPVVAVTGKVVGFDNGNGHTVQAMHIATPKQREKCASTE